MVENKEEEVKIKRKIRAWCSLCYQFFENSPFTKMCKDHYQKRSCNLFECKKEKNCVRRFPNVNSENRHTYCLSKDDVSNWSSGFDIQFCLNNDKIESKIANNEEEKINENKIDMIFNLDNNLKSEDFLINNFDNTIKEISELSYFKNKEDDEIDNDEDSLVTEFNKFNFNKPENEINLFKTMPIYIIKDETPIDEIFDLVYNATKISKTVLNKLKSAFKKRGLVTAEIIRLLKSKTGNWNFLYKDFKNICTQIQGISLYLENLLEMKKSF